MYRFTAVALLALSAGHALNAQEQKSEARVVVLAPEAGAEGEQKIEKRVFRIGAGADSKAESRVALIRPYGKTVENLVADSVAASDEPGRRLAIIGRGPDAGAHGGGDPKAKMKGEARVVIAGPGGIKVEWTTGGAARAQGVVKDGKRSVKVVIEENGETHVFDGDDIASLEFLPESVRKWITADGDGPRMLRFFREGAGGAEGPAGAAGAFRFRSGDGDGDGFQWQKHAKELQKQLEGFKFNFDFDFDTDSIMESVRKALAEALNSSGLDNEDRAKILKAIEGLRLGADAGGGGPWQGPMRGFMQPGQPGEDAMPEAVRERLEAMRERLAQQQRGLQERAEVERRRAEQTIRERENLVRERFRAREREQAHAPTPPAAPAGDADARIQRLEERLERIERMLERLMPRS